MSNFACDEILILLFPVILNNPLSHTLACPARVCCPLQTLELAVRQLGRTYLISVCVKLGLILSRDASSVLDQPGRC